MKVAAQFAGGKAGIMPERERALAAEILAPYGYTRTLQER